MTGRQLSAYDLIPEIARDAAHLPGALCRGESPLFDRATDDDRVAAAEICSRCVELSGCRLWVESLPVRRRPCGVVAGQVVR